MDIVVYEPNPDVRKIDFQIVEVWLDMWVMGQHYTRRTEQDEWQKCSCHTPAKYPTYYPECDGEYFDVNLPTWKFDSDTQAVEAYQKQYGSQLMAVVKDDGEGNLSTVYERG